MTNAFAASMARNFDDALSTMEAALAECPDALWEVDLWPDTAPTRPGPHGGVMGSAPWFLAYHALSCLDYDLTGGFERWEPPPPFHEHVWGLSSRVFNKEETLGYLAWCRERVARTLDGLTEEAAARPLPPEHRYQGMPFGVMIGGIPLHVVEHATQIRQFIALREAGAAARRG